MPVQENLKERMKRNPEIHYRRSIRLQGYDYSQPGMYFITICTQNRDCLFGEIIDGKMVLNDVGMMIEKWYGELPNKFPDIKCDHHIIMPNHIHFIIQIIDIVNVGADLCVCPINKTPEFNVGADLCVCPDNEIGQTHRFAPTNISKTGEHMVEADLCVCPDTMGEHMVRGEHTGSPLRKIIQWFKTMTTNEYIRRVKRDGWKPFDGKLWQRNYYEHIIRNEKELNQIREYILHNPLKWELDKEYVPNKF